MNGSACYPAAALVFLLGVILPAPVRGAEMGVNSTTLIRIEQRAFPGLARQTLVPATEFIGADMEKLGDGNLSFHLYGWGRADLTDRSTSGGTTDGDLAHGYLKYRFPTANREIRAGRIFVREGVAIEPIDGVSARADLKSGLTLALFGGVPVRLDREGDGKGDYIAGGRGGYRLGGLLELGVSGLHEGGITPDPAGGTGSDRQLVGGDIWALPHPVIELNGHTYYNAATDGLAEHSYLVAVRPHGSLTVSGSYNEVRFRNFFANSTIRSLFNPDTNGEQRSYGGRVTWLYSAPLEVSVDYRRRNRSGASGGTAHGNSHRFGGELRLTLLYKQLRSGLSYHRGDGAGGFNSYHELRGYGLYDAGPWVASLDVIAQIYGNAVFNRKEALEVIASAGYRLLAELALSGEIIYASNPRLDDEVRGVLRLTYNYAYTGKGAKK